MKTYSNMYKNILKKEKKHAKMEFFRWIGVAFGNKYNYNEDDKGKEIGGKSYGKGGGNQRKDKCQY